ncbi:hypothetical protein HDU87_008252 [Geranomyces variabilis]|uniref:HNH nuclease domain-containing protein n=1 Tax=Geranomyces variabilis TaxID=109894 RepID=A0AAD5XJ83_9FUNG|nr:hypothetical protein HDU87_008252 [Geranomyces variabilis]
MLACYSPDTVINSTDIDTIHNVITLMELAHAEFGRFSWVVDVDQWTVDCLDESLDTTWWVKATRGSIQDAQFLCQQDGPLAPNADYLRLHASLGRVLWASGRAEELAAADEEDPDTFPEAVEELVAADEEDPEELAAADEEDPDTFPESVEELVAADEEDPEELAAADEEDPDTFPESVREPIQRVVETVAEEDWRIEVA